MIFSELAQIRARIPLKYPYGGHSTLGRDPTSGQLALVLQQKLSPPISPACTDIGQYLKGSASQLVYEGVQGEKT